MSSYMHFGNDDSSSSEQRHMQSIDDVLYDDEDDLDGVRAPTGAPFRSTTKQPVEYTADEDTNKYDCEDDDDDEFAAFDKLIEDYETACASMNFMALLALPVPADPEDVWSEVEDVVVRNRQWDYLLQMMQKFEKNFDTDFMADIVSSGYSDEQKVCVIELALHTGWKINSPKSNGDYILYDALDNDTDITLGCLLHYGADPNLFITDLILETEDPVQTSTGLPLQEAITYGSLTQMELLLRHNANPALANAIHTAIRSSDQEAMKIKLLLAFGADKNALEWSGNPVVSALLVAQGIPQAPALAVTYELGKQHVVQFLLDTSVDPAAFTPRGKVLPGIKRERRARQRVRRGHMDKGKADVLGTARKGSSSSRSPLSGMAGKGGKMRAVNVKRGVRMRRLHQTGSP